MGKQFKHLKIHGGNYKMSKDLIGSMQGIVLTTSVAGMIPKLVP